MNVRRMIVTLNLAGVLMVAGPRVGVAQCCLNDLFAGFHSCFNKAPQAYAIAPVVAPVAAPAMAPMMAPVPVAPPPVSVPVQQVSYVPETTYRTEYRSVPVTSYKPSCEIDPCTGCPRDCMEQVTNYVQQPVNVPVTQYRAVYSTKYVQMQPQQGYAQPAYTQPAYAQPAYAQPAYAQPAVGAPVMAPAAASPSAWVPGTNVAPGPAGAATSPFAAPVQTAPQAWGAAGADISQQIVPGQTSISAPALQQGGNVAQPTYQPQIVPQSGSFAPTLQQVPTLQPTAPPSLTPAPSMRPIPELPKSSAAGQSGAAPAAAATVAPATGGSSATAPAATGNAPAAGQAPAATPVTGEAPQAGAQRLVPIPAAPASPAPRAVAPGMPTVPGPGPGTTTGAFPRLLAPTAHTTSWQPVAPRPAAYPTAALPSRSQQ